MSDWETCIEKAARRENVKPEAAYQVELDNQEEDDAGSTVQDLNEIDELDVGLIGES